MNETIATRPRCRVRGTETIRVAVGFFGMIRNISHTIGSIRANLLIPVGASAAGAVDVFVHTLAKDSNRNVRLDALRDAERLDPCRLVVERQELVDAAESVLAKAQSSREDTLASHAELRSRGEFPLPTRYPIPVLMNWIRSRYSLFRLASLVRAYEDERGFRYTHVVSARPDTSFLTLLSVPFEEEQGVLHIPNAHHNSGINDRFALGNRGAMLTYMRQYESLASKLGFTRDVRSTEASLCRHVVRSNLSVRLLPLCVVRTRKSGQAAKRDLHSVPHAPYECVAKGLRLATQESDFVQSCPNPDRHLDVQASIPPRLRPSKCRVTSLPVPGDVWTAATSASENCRAVVYTTAIYDERITDLRSRYWKDVSKQVCYVAFVGEWAMGTLPAESFGQWRPVTVRTRRTPSEPVNTRRISKLLKTMPHIFFPNVEYIMYLDLKLRLTMHPMTLILHALKDNRTHSAFFQHPCTASPSFTKGPCKRAAALMKVPVPKDGFSGAEWVRHEARLVSDVGRTGNASHLTRTAMRHAVAVSTTDHRYADTAIVIYRVGVRSFDTACRWHTQMVEDGIDRDQVSLFRVLHTHPDGIRLLPTTRPACGSFCTWWLTPDVASQVPRARPRANALPPHSREKNGKRLR